MLLSLLVLPLLAVWYGQLRRQRQQAVVRLGPLGVVQSQTGQAVGRRRHVPPLLFGLGVGTLLFGLARPEMPVSLPRVEGTVILAFDVSSSMLADDLQPTRLDAAKTAVRAFVENQPSTIQLGVVAFSNGGLVVQPPTNVAADVVATVDRLSPAGGTSLGQGIFTALSAIAGKPLAIDEAVLAEGTGTFELPDYSSAVILLLTDGENSEAPDPLAVAQVAANAGVRIYPIGIGTAEGSVLELDGFSVVTQLNEPLLEEIASVTNGRYYHATDAETLADIYQNVDLQLTVAGEKMEVTALLAVVGLLFFLLGGVLMLVWFGRIP
ncbi:MAG: VWA domain-containing protein [Ardenticatenaceae bacterium]|nr:VWA domain-containing protein [Ardenticatenaceae bacterium]